jgi:hypothetical protein
MGNTGKGVEIPPMMPRRACVLTGCRDCSAMLRPLLSQADRVLQRTVNR